MNDPTTAQIVADAQASVVDLITRELHRAELNRDTGASPSRVLYENTKIELLAQLRDRLAELLGEDLTGVAWRE